jgi:plastocyanin
VSVLIKKVPVARGKVIKMKIRILFLIVATLFAVGCASLPKISRTGVIHEVRIEDTLSNPNLTVQAGDEIRWVNVRTESVSIEFTPESEESFSCNHGFTNWLGRSKAVANVDLGESVSLCFSKNGIYKYNVRMKAAVPGGAIIVSGVINVGNVQP